MNPSFFAGILILMLPNFSMSIPAITTVFQKLTQPQKILLNSFKSCTLRLLYFGKFPVDTNAFLFAFYSNNAAFILESGIREFKTSSPKKIDTTRYTNIKFNQCYNILLLTDNLKKSVNFYSYLRKTAIFFRNEDPAAVVYMKFKSTSYNPTLLSQFHNIHFTSKFFYFSRNSSYIYCLMCSQHEQKLEIKSSTELSELFWTQMYKKYGGQLAIHAIGVSKGRWDDPVHGMRACEVQPKRRILDKGGFPHTNNLELCFLRTIKNLLNLTFVENETWMQFGSTYLMFAAPIFFPKNKEFRYVPFPAMVITDEYNFGVVTNIKYQAIQGLTKPFSLLTWLLLLASTVGLSIFFRLAAKVTKNGTDTTESLVFSILIEQSQDAVTKCKSKRVETLGLLVAWLLLSFIVTNAYKGVLFTILAMVELPAEPKTLQELVEAKDYNVITISAFSGGGLITSSVKQHLRKIFAKSDVLQLRDQVLYEQLYPRIILMPLNPVPLFSKITLQKEYHNVSLSVNFVILDKVHSVESIRQLFSMFYSNRTIVTGQKFELFSTRRQWLSKRKHFFKLMYPYLNGIIESGIFGRWERFARIVLDIKRIKALYAEAVKAKIDMTTDRFTPKDNILAFMFLPFRKHFAETTFEPISLKFFSVFAVLFGYSIACCITAFVFECLMKCNERYKVFRRA